MSEVINERDDEERSSVLDLRTGENGYTLIVEGDVDIATAPRLQTDIATAFDRKIDELIIDLRGISFIDSTGLGVLINARQKARGVGVSLKLMLPEGAARFPFEVTGLASMFDTEPAE